MLSPALAVSRIGHDHVVIGSSGFVFPADVRAEILNVEGMIRAVSLIVNHAKAANVSE